MSKHLDEKLGVNEKHEGVDVTVQAPDTTDIVEVSKDLGATINDLVDVGDKLDAMSLEKCRAVSRKRKITLVAAFLTTSM